LACCFSPREAPARLVRLARLARFPWLAARFSGVADLPVNLPAIPPAILPAIFHARACVSWFVLLLFALLLKLLGSKDKFPQPVDLSALDEFEGLQAVASSAR
jgi:hypothetical protein